LHQHDPDAVDRCGSTGKVRASRNADGHAHGEPLGVEEVRLTKRALGWPEDGRFYVPEAALREFRASIRRGGELEATWRNRMERCQVAYPGLSDEFAHALAGELPEGWEAHLPLFTPTDGEMATRDAGGAVMNAVAGIVTNLVGGSADLDPSTRTTLKGCGDFESPLVVQSGEEVATQGTSGGVWGSQDGTFISAFASTQWPR
jgi:transketolase